MSTIKQQVYDYLADSEDEMPIYVAPNFSDKIWHQRQNKKSRQYLYSIASICLLILILCIPSKTNSTNTSYLIAQNQALEVRLAQVSFINLTITQQKTMTRWYAELELIDQNIEQQSGDFIDPNLWPDRARLLSQMIDFYLHPFEIYEI